MEMNDASLQVLAGAGAGAVHHHGGTLLDHLAATHRLLVSWGCAPQVRSAGLFHSFYAWLAQPTERSRAALARAIGPQAEELVYIFGSTEPDDLLEPSVHGRQVQLKTAFGTAPVPIETYADLLWLDLANTEDLLARASPTPAQRERLQKRCAQIRELLRTIASTPGGECEGTRV